jgi:hypothetical protein
LLSLTNPSRPVESRSIFSLVSLRNFFWSWLVGYCKLATQLTLPWWLMITQSSLLVPHLTHRLSANIGTWRRQHVHCTQNSPQVMILAAIHFGAPLKSIRLQCLTINNNQIQACRQTSLHIADLDYMAIIDKFNRSDAETADKTDKR